MYEHKRRQRSPINPVSNACQILPISKKKREVTTNETNKILTKPGKIENFLNYLGSICRCLVGTLEYFKPNYRNTMFLNFIISPGSTEIQQMEQERTIQINPQRRFFRPGIINTIYNADARYPLQTRGIFDAFKPVYDNTNNSAFYPCNITNRLQLNHDEHMLKHKDLTLISINTTSINSQRGMARLEEVARFHDADIICVQETSMNPNVPNNWQMNGYTIVSQEDKKWGSGDNPGWKGGSCIFVKNNYVHLCKTIVIDHGLEKCQISATKFDISQDHDQ